MIVKDLVETRELLADETPDNVFVMYERFDNKDCQCKGDMVEEIECDPEEIIQIFVGHPEASQSLKSAATYKVGENFTSIEAIIKDIKLNHSHYLVDKPELTPLG
ncbi:hypothetical protein MM221_18585 [Salipaludibacillus sp. LMS25]|uniref:hypothetical protein n=1 Tax=Salipaludibacillus sp. LMS25 TaxID=2924031 RepID=UPI0020D000AA|nr:hypothetical protein [Salipaludibacillus sp. LMS25]UTR14537.1 hypothetical protein MM221_18585 [Salipaludibacillus sp. LMS25]